MRGFPSFSRRFIEFELPMDEGWILYAWLMENDPLNALCGVVRDGKGYIAQEVERVLERRTLTNGQ